MKRILLSLLTVSSLTTSTLPALADSVYVQAGPIGFSFQEHDHFERREYHPYYYGERREYGPYYYGERREYRPYYHEQRAEYRPYYYGERR